MNAGSRNERRERERKRRCAGFGQITCVLVVTTSMFEQDRAKADCSNWIWIILT